MKIKNREDEKDEKPCKKKDEPQGNEEKCEYTPGLL